MAKRIWLIGSGPSLNQTNLNLLTEHNEASFGMNRCHLLFEHTSWRPTYYFKVDLNPYHTHFWRDEIYAALRLGIPMWIWEDFRDGTKDLHHFPDGGIGDLPNTTWIPRCKHHGLHGLNTRSPDTWHLPELCTHPGGMFTMMQLAYKLGYDEIYLLGCDLGYGEDYDQNFWTPDYQMDKRGKRAARDNEDQQRGHQIAQNTNLIQIFNASPGGNLETWVRRDMEEVLNG